MNPSKVWARAEPVKAVAPDLGEHEAQDRNGPARLAHLSPELQAKLSPASLASGGTDAQALAREAIERLVDYDDRFVREVEKGLAQIEQGEILSHEEVGARLEQYLTEKRPHP